MCIRDSHEGDAAVGIGHHLILVVILIVGQRLGVADGEDVYKRQGLAQLVRAPASHAGGHWFESSSLHQKAPDFLRNQELFFLFITKKFALNFCFFSDQYTDQYRDSSR